MRHKTILAALGVVCLLFGLTGTLRAQRVQGTISGVVSDPSGAVVPKAEVTITNLQTGSKRTVTANDAGFYTAPNLEPGAYTVGAKAAGFKTVEKSGIDLHVADEKVVHLVLEVGAATEAITVTGGATQVETRSGEVSNVIGTQQIQELPLNGRSFVQLTLLVPGASPSDTENPRFTGLLGGVDISMSGSPANANAWLVDGVDNVDHGSGRTILVYPSVDSIEEFKVQRNSYGADMPAAGGAEINLVTKGGTNTFHGSAYEFFRNDKLDANNFFLNQAGKPKGELRSNNWGYTFGGPIKKDKLFFFWSEEWRREVRGVTRLSSVPTDLERQGIFSSPRSVQNPQQPISPFTGKPFPNDTIPSDQLSPAGLAIMKLFPPENTPGAVFNWVEAVPTHLSTRQEQIRADYSISSKNNLMVRFTNDQWANPAPNFGGDGGLWGDTGFPTVDSSWAQPSKALGTRLTTIFGPTMINTFQFSYSNNRIFITNGIGKDINTEINSKVASVFPGVPGHAHAIFWGAPEQGIGNNLWNAAPWNNAHDIFSWKDDFSKTSGNHNFRVGAFYSYDKKDEDCCGASETTPQFWGPTAVPGGAGIGGGWGPAEAPGNGNNVTGNGLADLLLKGAYWGGSEQSSQPRSKVRWKDIEFYYADTWRASRRLTLDYGVRWSILPPSIQADDRIGNFIPSLYDPSQGSSNPLNGMIYPTGLSMASAGIPGGSANLRGIHVGRALRNSSYDTISPRFGIAFDPTGAGKWAIRAGAGMFFGRSDLSQPIGELLLNPPFNSTISFGNGRPLDALPPVLPTAGVGVAGNAADINWKVQGSYQWNFTVERELFRDTKLEVAYLGNRGHHLPMNWDLNDVAPQNRLQFAQLNFSGADSSTRDSLHALAPLVGTNNLYYQSNGGTSSYHAFQAYLTKRLSHHFSMGASYSYSKLLSIVSLDCCGNGGGARLADPWNFRYNRGPADFDRPNIFSSNVIYNLPELLGKPAIERFVLGGWEATGIYSYATGVPLTVGLNQNLLGISGDRPDLVANPKGPDTATGGWFNASAFRVPFALGVPGSEGVGVLHGPATNNADLSIYKNFRVTEKTHIQFRFETFNTFNHTQFFSTNINNNYQVSGLSDLKNPTKAYNAVTNPFLDHFTACNAMAGHSFPDCNINTAFGLPQRSRDPRELQLALKFIF
jgi:carboxypeptidase family protein